MSFHPTVTLPQVRKMLALTEIGVDRFVDEQSLDVHLNGNIEFVLRSRKSLTAIVGFVILDEDGEQIVNVTPHNGNTFVVRKFAGIDGFDESVVSGPKDDTTVYSVALRQAREFANEDA